MPAAGTRRPSGAARARLSSVVAGTLNVAEHPSPNFTKRRDGLTPTMIVLHHTAMATAEAAIERLCDPHAEVSAHYVICKTGKITRLVAEEMRAWHAGAGEWQGLRDINSRSIGIELDNDGSGPFSFALMDSLEALLRHILHRWAIPPANVIGHSDMAPGRKVDPGPWFDWVRLEEAGLAGRRGHDPGPQDPDMASFRSVAQYAGYTAPASDEVLLSAVRLRYRSFASGPLAPEDYTPLGHTALWT